MLNSKENQKMSKKRNSLILIICSIFLIISSNAAKSGVEISSKDIDVAFEYDNNVTRERFKEDYQYGIIWRLRTGFDVRNFIPVKGLNTRAGYALGMRDVNTTNDEDYSSHIADLSSSIRLRTNTIVSLREELKIWNSQNDLFNFSDNAVQMELSQPFGTRTSARLLYRNEQKWFENDVPEVQARNFLYHLVGIDLFHSISSAFRVQLGYIHQYSMYNRSPIDFRGDMPVVLDGVQRDRQNIFTLGFRTSLLNDTTTLSLQNQVLRSKSNSRAFNFDGNRARIILVSKPLEKLSVNFIYRIVAYDLEAYQTPDLGYELGEIRTEDQSGISLGVTYDISKQAFLEIGYEHIANTVFFTREFYNTNTFSVGLRIRP